MCMWMHLATVTVLTCILYSLQRRWMKVMYYLNCASSVHNWSQSNCNLYLQSFLVSLVSSVGGTICTAVILML